MRDSDIPVKMPIPWASQAAGAYIRATPQTSQIGILPGAASYPTGWVPLNFLDPITQGGVPPSGQDGNGINNAITSWLRWYQSGGPVAYDPTFQTAIGGYPNGAVVASVAYPNCCWRSLIDNNLENPETVSGSVGWGFAYGDPPDLNYGGTSGLVLPNVSAAIWINNTTGSAFTLLLPPPTPIAPYYVRFTFKDIAGNANSTPTTILGNGALIDGLSAKQIDGNYGGFTLRFYSGNWQVLS